MKDKLIDLAVTVGVEAIAVSVYMFWASKKIVKCLENRSYEEEVREAKEES